MARRTRQYGIVPQRLILRPADLLLPICPNAHRLLCRELAQTADGKISGISAAADRRRNRRLRLAIGLPRRPPDSVCCHRYEKSVTRRAPVRCT